MAPVEVDELRAIWDALINGRVTPVPPINGTLLTYSLYGRHKPSAFTRHLFRVRLCEKDFTQNCCATIDYRRCTGLAFPAGAAGGNGAGHSLASSDCALAAGARREKAVKQRLIVAADHFNRDYRKGLQYLQVFYPQPETDK